MNPFHIDGAFGAGAETATKTFQQKMWIGVTGVVNSLTWQYLFGYDAYPGGGSVVTGNESDGYPKAMHRDMDLHNNEVGRCIGVDNKQVSEDDIADIIYNEISYSST